MSWKWIVTTALIAAFIMSYGLLSRRGEQPSQTQEITSQPSLYFKDAVLTQTRPDGTVRLKLSANRIEQHQDASNDILASTVRVDYLSKDTPVPWTLTAMQGFVRGNSSVVEFSGDVLMRREDQPGAFRTEKLSLDVDHNLANTSSPVVVEYGPNQLHAVGLKADMNRGVVNLESNVNGRFEPK
jgi:lipopolysaccharide export system protein LptC